MAITQGVCNSFKQEQLEGDHDFQVAGDSIKLALYTSSATLSKSTTAYTATNEVSGTGYTATGQALTNVAPTLSGDTALIDFADETWSSSTITARGALAYNDTLAGDPAVFVLDFGSDKSSSSGDFVVIFPTADASNAILRLA